MGCASSAPPAEVKDTDNGCPNGARRPSKDAAGERRPSKDAASVVEKNSLNQRDPTQPISQKEVLEMWLPRLETEGTVYKKFVADFCRPARTGETVRLFCEQVEYATKQIGDDPMWVVQPDIFSLETYVIPAEQFQAEYPNPGVEVSGERARLGQLGFKKFQSDKELLALPADKKMLSQVTSGMVETSIGASKIPECDDVMLVVTYPAKKDARFVPAHVVREKYRIKGAPISQSELLEIFKPDLQAGLMYKRVAPDYARKARLGEEVTSVVDGQVRTTVKVADSTSWVVRAATFSGETIVLSKSDFETSHLTAPKPIEATNEGLKHLAAQGYQLYEVTKVLRVKRLTTDEIEMRVPGGMYEGPGGHGNSVRIMPDSYVCCAPDFKGGVIFVSEHLLLEAYEPHEVSRPFTQKEVLDALKTKLPLDRFEKRGVDLARRAICGEVVKISDDSVLVIDDRPAWVVLTNRRATTLVLSNADFTKHYPVDDGAPLLGDTPYDMHLRKEGYQQFKRLEQLIAMQLTKEMLISEFVEGGQMWMDEACTQTCTMVPGDYILINSDLNPSTLRMITEKKFNEQYCAAEAGGLGASRALSRKSSRLDVSQFVTVKTLEVEQSVSETKLDVDAATLAAAVVQSISLISQGGMNLEPDALTGIRGQLQANLMRETASHEINASQVEPAKKVFIYLSLKKHFHHGEAGFFHAAASARKMTVQGQAILIQALDDESLAETQRIIEREGMDGVRDIQQKQEKRVRI